MSYALPNKDAADREALRLNERGIAGVEYRPRMYPNGTNGPWPWGVGRYELNYGKNGEERFLGFYWFAPR